MEFLNQYMTVIIAAAVVIALLLAVLLLLRHFSRRTRGRQGNRLGINEYHVVDEQRRLVLIRRDGVEHLLLIGGGQDVVVEANIRELAARTHREVEMDEEVEVPTRITPAAAQPIPLRPPRAPVFADRRPQLRPVEPPMSGPRSFDQDT